jgi:hypothetical protein
MTVMNRAVRILLILLLGTAGTMAAERRMPLPNPVLFMYGYGDSISDEYRPIWEKTLKAFTAFDGITQDAKLVKRLRSEGKIFAYHVWNPVDAGNKTVEGLVASWSAPFENTLGGGLPGGFDGITIDEFRSCPDGSEDSRMLIEALRRVRLRYPDRLIFVSGVWLLADGGPHGLFGLGQSTYDDVLNAIYTYADIFILENYQRTRKPQFQMFESMAKNIETRRPGLLKKTIYALYISQSAPFFADDDPKVNFYDFLESQLTLIKAGDDTRRMPGVGYWVFYRSKPETLEKVVSLTERYFPKER